MLSLFFDLLSSHRKKEQIYYQPLFDVFLYNNYPIICNSDYKKELLKVLAQNSYRYIKVNDLLCVVLKENEKDIPLPKLKKRLNTLLDELDNDLRNILDTNTIFLQQQNQHDRRLKEIKLNLTIKIKK